MRASTRKETILPKDAGSCVEIIGETLENYARRGIFRRFSRGAFKNGTASFRMVWHRDRVFNFVFDSKRGTMRFPLVLPHVASDSRMYLDLKEFIKSRHSDELPYHRRIDSRKAQVGAYLRGGNVSITLTVRNADYQYGAKKLINLVHEIFLVFLADGYFEYMVEAFDLDPDRM